MDNFIIFFDTEGGLMDFNLPKVIKANSCKDACERYLNDKSFMVSRCKKSDNGRICVLRGCESDVEGKFIRKGPKCWYNVYKRRNYE